MNSTIEVDAISSPFSTALPFALCLSARLVILTVATALAGPLPLKFFHFHMKMCPKSIKISCFASKLYFGLTVRESVLEFSVLLRLFAIENTYLHWLRITNENTGNRTSRSRSETWRVQEE